MFNGTILFSRLKQHSTRNLLIERNQFFSSKSSFLSPQRVLQGFPRASLHSSSIPSQTLLSLRAQGLGLGSHQFGFKLMISSSLQNIQKRFASKKTDKPKVAGWDKSLKKPSKRKTKHYKMKTHKVLFSIGLAPFLFGSGNAGCNQTNTFAYGIDWLHHRTLSSLILFCFFCFKNPRSNNCINFLLGRCSTMANRGAFFSGRYEAS